MVQRRLGRLGAALLMMVSTLVATPASAQITTGNVSGSVKDAQGGVVPGATVVLISETKGTKSAPAVTSETGDYTFPNITADTYTVESDDGRLQDAEARAHPRQRRRPRRHPARDPRGRRHGPRPSP